MERHACADESSEKYRTLYEQQELFDVILIAGIDGVRLSAHRSVLTKWSGYFKGVFRSQLKEAQTGEIELKEFDGETLKLVLDFMYTVPIELCSEMAVNVLKAADYLQISTLVDYCSDILPDYLQTSNCMGILLFSEQQNYLTLRNKTYIFVYSNFEDVCNEEEFLQLNEGELNKFILDDRRFFRSEEKLYTSLVKWVEHDKPNRENSLLNLLKHIDVRRLEPEFIIEHTLPRHLPADSRTRRTNQLVKVNEGGPLRIHTFYPDLDAWIAENWPPPSITSIHLLAVVNKNLIVSDRFRFACLDLETMKWTELPQVSEGSTATEMTESEGDLFVVTEIPRIEHSIHKYDFSTRRWMDEHVELLDYSLKNLTVHDGILYSCGENGNLQWYDYKFGNLTTMPLGKSRRTVYAIAVMGENLYIVSDTNNPQIDRFFPSTNSFTKIGLIGHKLEGLIVRVRYVVFNKRLLVYRGDNRFGFLVEYNPETNQITSFPSFKENVILFTIQN